MTIQKQWHFLEIWGGKKVGVGGERVKRTLPLRNELGNLKPQMRLPNPRSK